jgi:hypothetical protein
MIPWLWMLKHPLTMLTGCKACFKNSNCKRDCPKLGLETIDIEYDDSIASDSEQCQKVAIVGYVNPQGHSQMATIQKTT